MTLSFSTQCPSRIGEQAGQPNYFVEKIWSGLLEIDCDFYSDYLHPDGRPDLIKSPSFYKDFKPKLHTIREDKNDRWKAGMDIHMVINNRTKNRFQFAPVLKCVSVQEIEIKYTKSSNNTPLIYVGIESQKTKGYMLCLDTYNPESKSSSFGLIDKLAINDGFDSVEDFFAYFNTDFSGKLIHWTELVY